MKNLRDFISESCKCGKEKKGEKCECEEEDKKNEKNEEKKEGKKEGKKEEE